MGGESSKSSRLFSLFVFILNTCRIRSLIISLAYLATVMAYKNVQMPNAEFLTEVLCFNLLD